MGDGGGGDALGECDICGVGCVAELAGYVYAVVCEGVCGACCDEYCVVARVSNLGRGVVISEAARGREELVPEFGKRVGVCLLLEVEKIGRVNCVF